MKKTLIALAVLAVSGAAFAQSSVTVYGVADIAVGAVGDAVVVNTSDADPKTTYGVGISNDKFQAFANGTMNNGSSRLGVRGTEDLGGGLKAGFNFEQGVSLASGATDGNTFQRAANVSLMGGFGEVRLGRSLSTSYYSVAAWELTGTANYSAVAKQFSFAGAGSRNDATVMYFSPSMGGFKFAASTILKGNTAGATDSTKPGSKYDLSATFTEGPLVASLAYNSQDMGNTGMSLGGKYNFGAFTVAASFQSNEKEATGVKVAEGYTVGATTTIGPIAMTFDIARDTEAKDTDWVLEAKYPLSKRTFIYGVALGDGKNDSVSTTVSKVTTTTGKTTKNATAYAVGIRHNF